MAYSENDLRHEIEDLIRADLEAGNVVVRGWVVHAILSKHPLPQIADRDFNHYCRERVVASMVREIVHDWKKRDDDPEFVAGEATLPGFNRLRLGYPLERDGKLVLVPIVRMTRDEGLFKRDKYYAMAAGCEEHAEELDRYFSSPPAAA